jgi:hypothetical protein
VLQGVVLLLLIANTLRCRLGKPRAPPHRLGHVERHVLFGPHRLLHHSRPRSRCTLQASPTSRRRRKRRARCARSPATLLANARNIIGGSTRHVARIDPRQYARSSAAGD